MGSLREWWRKHTSVRFALDDELRGRSRIARIGEISVHAALVLRAIVISDN
jgi:hypothetical protein